MLLQVTKAENASDLYQQGTSTTDSQRSELSLLAEQLCEPEKFSESKLASAKLAFIQEFSPFTVRYFQLGESFLAKQALIIPTSICKECSTYAAFLSYADGSVIAAKATGERFLPNHLLVIDSVLGHQKSAETSFLRIAEKLKKRSIALEIEPLNESIKVSHFNRPFQLWAMRFQIDALFSILTPWIKHEEAFDLDAKLPDPLDQYVRSTIAAGIARFEAELNSSVLQILPPRCSATAAGYNYYNAESPEIRRNRVQAAISYPPLKNLLPKIHNFDLIGGATIDGYNTITNAIDAAQPLIPAMCAALELNSDQLRSLQNSEIQFCDREEFEAVLRLLRHVQKEFRPHSAEDWSAAIAVIRMLPSTSGLAVRLHFRNPSLQSPVRRVLNDAEVNWWPQLGRLAQKMGWPGVKAKLTELGINDFADFASAVIDVARKGRTVSDAVRLRMLSQLCSSHPLLKLAELSHAWHRRMIQEQGKQNHPNGKRPDSWPMIQRNPLEFPFGQIVPLLSRRALDEEGHNLQHCAGSFGGAAATGDSFLFSVRDSAGSPVSTIELSLINEDVVHSEQAWHIRPAFEVVQHRAYGNGNIGFIAQQAEHDLLKRIANGQTDVSSQFFWRRLRRCHYRKSFPKVPQLPARAIAVSALKGFEDTLKQLARIAQAQFVELSE